MTAASQRLRGLDAPGIVGDYVLQNSRVTAVIDDPADPEHRHGIHPSGGTLIDLVSADGSVDHLNQISQVVGILPRDALFYDRAEALSDGAMAAVIVRGHLAGRVRATGWRPPLGHTLSLRAIVRVAPTRHQ